MKLRKVYARPPYAKDLVPVLHDIARSWTKESEAIADEMRRAAHAWDVAATKAEDWLKGRR